jgi:hypothetical protein
VPTRRTDPPHGPRSRHGYVPPPTLTPDLAAVADLAAEIGAPGKIPDPRNLARGLGIAVRDAARQIAELQRLGFWG